MNLFAFDDVLLDRVYQPMADCINLRLGRNCFWLARQCTLASAVMIVIYDAEKAYRAFIGGSSLSMLLLTGAGMSALFGTIYAFVIYWITNAAERMTRNGLNPFRQTRYSRLYSYVLVALSIALLLIPTGDLFDWFYVFFTLAMHAATYFLSCNPMPPPVRKEAPKTILVGAQG